MTSRGRYSLAQDWDPMREDYDTTYDAQYPDDEVGSGGVQLDHCKLYVKNIPKAINEEGLRTAFAAYGNLLKVYLSRDPLKRYALITYETPSEAKLAMMKLNRTEPLKFSIHIAHKKNDTQQSQPKERRSNNMNSNYETETNYRNDTGTYSYRNDSSSVSSRERHGLKRDDYGNGGNIDISFQDEDILMGYEEVLEPELDLEYELNCLKLREEEIQCKKRKLLLQHLGKKTTVQKPIANRCILPDGRIVVRNVNDRPLDQQDSSFNSAAGDSSSLPALQRAASRHCLWCGAPAEAFCARCGLAPYCSGRCQQRDWTQRHRSVCHNLARLMKQGDSEKDIEAIEPVAPVPLRRPHSPAAATPSPRREFNDENHDRPRKNFYPAGDAAHQTSQKANNRGNNKSFKNQTFRRPTRQNDTNDEEEESFEPKVEPKAPAQPTPVQRPKPVESVPNTSYHPAKSVPKPDPVPPYQPVKSPIKPETVPYQPEKSPTKPETVPYQPVKSPIKPETVPYRSVKDDSISEPVMSYPPVKKEPVAGRVETVLEVKKVVAPVTDATPARKLVPNNYLIETLSVGDTVLLSVDVKASECRSKSSGYVCLSLHEKSELDYQLLCEDYSMDCETAPDCKPSPGDLFSYRNPEDGAYYRARCLNSTSAALIDSSKIVSLSPTDKCKVIPPTYEAIVEFCCVLEAPNIKIGDSVMITIKSKSAEGCKVQIENAETGGSVGEVFRWMPLVEYPVPKPVPAGPVIPEVPRPELKNNSTVLLVEGASLDRVLVRPVDKESMRKFDAVLQDALQFGMKASPIKEPPLKGQVVIGKFSDGNCYRALVKRVNVKANKYQLEYIEFGNIEVNPRETIYACPQSLDLNSSPTVVSAARLRTNTTALTPPALQYIENLRDNNVELVLSLPDGSKSAPSGSEVELSVAKNNQSVNKKINLMCTPEWKKIEEQGGDILQSERLLLSDMGELELPAGGCELEISDVSMLPEGAVCGCQRVPGARAALAALTRQMEEYCNSEIGKEPYLPAVEELCIAQFPPDPTWYRAVVCEHLGGAGGAAVSVCYIDYGNLETVPVAALRKMLPEFVRGFPAMASHIEIQGFPAAPTTEMLARAAQHMNIDEEGRGTLVVTGCEKADRGVYRVEAPDLLKAMGVK